MNENKKNKTFCQQCGSPLNSEDRNCSQCGAPNPDFIEPGVNNADAHQKDAHHGLTCSKCGSPISYDDYCCTQCGSPNKFYGLNPQVSKVNSVYNQTAVIENKNKIDTPRIILGFAMFASVIIPLITFMLAPLGILLNKSAFPNDKAKFKKDAIFGIIALVLAMFLFIYSLVTTDWSQIESPGAIIWFK